MGYVYACVAAQDDEIVYVFGVFGGYFPVGVSLFEVVVGVGAVECVARGGASLYDDVGFPAVEED